MNNTYVPLDQVRRHRARGVQARHHHVAAGLVVVAPPPRQRKEVGELPEVQHARLRAPARGAGLKEKRRTKNKKKAACMHVRMRGQQQHGTHQEKPR